MENSKAEKLGSLVTHKKGYAFKSESYQNEGIPIIKVTNFTDNSVNTNDLDYVNEKIAQEQSNYELFGGDVVIQTVGSWANNPNSVVGKVIRIPKSLEKSLLNQNAVVIKPKEKLNNNYLYYLLKDNSFKGFIINTAQGAANQASITLDSIFRFEFYLPPIKTQKKIAAVLSAYDDLIENNKRRIALLEKMAEEIYREWFVRMRFPGCKETKFEKGLPVDWEIKRVDFLGRIVTGKTPSTQVSRYYGDSYFFIKTPDMHNQMLVLNTEEKLSEDGLKSQPSQTLPPNSISVSCIGTGGIISITTTKCQTNQQINSIILNNLSDLEWAFFTIKGLKETIQMFGSTGTTMTNLSKGKFSALKILVPNENLRISFSNSAKPIFSQMQFLMKNSQKLISSRNLLLSRLISGKLLVENLDIKFPPGMREDEEKEETANA